MSRGEYNKATAGNTQHLNCAIAPKLLVGDSGDKPTLFTNFTLCMYIKNQQFKDEDTLLEVLFDFEIGEPSPYISDLTGRIEQVLDTDETFQSHLKTLEEEDNLELYDDVRRDNVVRQLRADFTAFIVETASFYGISDEGRTLLYTIDMY